MKNKRYLIFMSLIFTLISCDRSDCSNQNPIFDQYGMNDEEYQTELVRQIEIVGQNNLNYWLDSYVKENNEEFLIVNVQHDSFCAKGKVLVNDWKKLEGIKRTKGESYEGAELKGLAFAIEREADKTTLVYTDLNRIID